MCGGGAEAIVTHWVTMEGTRNAARADVDKAMRFAPARRQPVRGGATHTADGVRGTRAERGSAADDEAELIAESYGRQLVPHL